MNAILLLLLLTPHVAMGLAWLFWFHSPLRSQLPKSRRIALFVSLLAGSLNIVAYWGYVVWLQRHFTTDAWRVRDFVFDICECLIAATIVGAMFGEGRVRVMACIAGILGFFLWVTTAIGIL